MLGIHATAGVLADVEVSTGLGKVRRSVFPGQFVAAPVHAQLTFTEVHVTGGFLQAEYVELNRLLERIRIVFQLEGCVKERSWQGGQVELQVDFACVVGVVCHPEGCVRIVRCKVVERRNPGIYTLAAGSSIARVVEGGVFLVEYIDLARVGAGLGTVVGLENQVVASASCKGNVGLVFGGIGEDDLTWAYTFFPKDRVPTETVTATVVFDGTYQMDLAGLHHDHLVGEGDLRGLVLALLGSVTGVKGHVHAAGAVLFKVRVREGVDSRTHAGFFYNLLVGVSAGKNFLEALDGKASVVIDEHGSGLCLVACDDQHA